MTALNGHVILQAVALRRGRWQLIAIADQVFLWNPSSLPVAMEQPAGSNPKNCSQKVDMNVERETYTRCTDDLMTAHQTSLSEAEWATYNHIDTACSRLTLTITAADHDNVFSYQSFHSSKSASREFRASLKHSSRTCRAG